MKGNILIEGVMMFGDLFTPGGAPGYPSKFSLTLGVAKGPNGNPTTSETALFAAMEEVAKRTWPSEWETKLSAIHRDIMEGAPPNDSKISLQDGDQYQPDYNAGFWVLKASRRVNQGPPEVFEEISEPGKPKRVYSAQEPNAPQNGWGVIALVNVWAQAKQSRINFTLLGLRGVQVGTRAGGPPPAAIEAAVQGMLEAPAPRQIAGVVAPTAELPQQAGAPSPGVAPENAAGATIPGSGVPSPSQTTVPVRQAPAGPPAKDLGLGGEGGTKSRVINL